MDDLDDFDFDGRIMDLYQAVGIAEGFIESESEEQTIEAWQYLIDTGDCWRLQGWFGRTAHQLLLDGVCHAPKIKTKKNSTDYCGNKIDFGGDINGRTTNNSNSRN